MFDVDPDTPEKGHTHPTQFGAVVDIFPLFCRRFDIRRFRLSPFWSLAVLTLAVLVCRRFDHRPFVSLSSRGVAEVCVFVRQ